MRSWRLFFGLAGCSAIAVAFVLRLTGSRSTPSLPDRQSHHETTRGVRAPSSVVSRQNRSSTPPLATRQLIPLLPIPQPGAAKAAESSKPKDDDASEDFGELRSLSYDESLDFRGNLLRLKDLCGRYDDEVMMRFPLGDFVRDLIGQVKGQTAVIESELAGKKGSAVYRQALLMCLVASESTEKTEILWRTALDDQEDLSVRRAASALMVSVDSGPRQPDLWRKLFSIDDVDVRLAALRIAPNHMDQENLGIIERTGQLPHLLMM